jgi:putative RecB family exonuclease
MTPGNGRGKMPDTASQRFLEHVQAILATTQPPPPVPPVQAAALPHFSLDPSIAAVLSPSQVNTYLDCSMKWYFRYVAQLPEGVRSGSLVLGSAIHRAVEVALRARIERQPEPELEALTEVYAASWRDQLEEGEIDWGKEAPEDVGSDGAVLLAKYFHEALPHLKPARIESRISGAIAGVPVRGFLDLLEEDGRIVDLKTSRRRPPSISPDYRLQISTYRILEPDATGAARLDTLVRTKTPQLVQLDCTIGAADVAYAEAIYPQAQEGMRSGLYTPNRRSFMCSRKYCAYWAACEREFGGEVAP